MSLQLEDAIRAATEGVWRQSGHTESLAASQTSVPAATDTHPASKPPKKQLGFGSCTVRCVHTTRYFIYTVPMPANMVPMTTCASTGTHTYMLLRRASLAYVACKLYAVWCGLLVVWCRGLSFKEGGEGFGSHAASGATSRATSRAVSRAASRALSRATSHGLSERLSHDEPVRDFLGRAKAGLKHTRSYTRSDTHTRSNTDTRTHAHTHAHSTQARGFANPCKTAGSHFCKKPALCL